MKLPNRHARRAFNARDLLAVAALLSIQFAGCGEATLEKIASEVGEIVENHTQTKVSIAPPPPPAGDTVTIGSFNIQTLGVSKMGNPEAVRIIVDTCRQFDVLAVQELRAVDQNIIPQLIAKLNEQGAAFDYLIGPRQGRSVSKEQYVFIYNTRRIQPKEIGFVVPDEQDLLHRPPVASRFQVKVGPGKTGFTFVLMNVHTDPDEVATEIPALAKAFQFVTANMPMEDDIIMAGDFNVGESKYGDIAAIGDMSWAITGANTNTRNTHAYDNLFFDSARTSEFTGNSGVLDFATHYNLSMEQALEVSDHFPVWATFSAYEQAAPVMAGRASADVLTR